MTSPQLSPEQRAEAGRIFKNAYIQGLIGAWIVSFVLSAIPDFIFHYKTHAGGLGAVVVLAPILAINYATRQVRKAGLSLARTETQFIPKTAPHFTGQPLNIHSDSTQTNGALGIATVLLLGALLIWHQRGGHGFSLLVVILCSFVLVACFLQASYCLSNPPVLYLGTNGVFNGAQHFWPQRASWSNIRKAEYQQSFDYRGQLTARRLIFRTVKGRDVVILFYKFPTTTFSEHQTDETMTPDEIIAQTGAILIGESKISGA